MIPNIVSSICQHGKVCTNFSRKNLRFSILVCNVYAITFAVVLPVLCNDWAYSQYYFRGWSRSEMEKKALSVNAYHAARAREYVDKITQNQSLNADSARISQQGGVDFAIGIVTVPRTHPTEELDYLTQTFAALHKIISHDSVNLNRKVLFMCNTFPLPRNHTELERLTAISTIYNRYSQDNITVHKLNNFEKEKQDYIYCLSVAQTYKPRYILIVEDDAVAVGNLFEVLEYVLPNVIEQKYSGGELKTNTDEWAYLKLFYPNRWKGYAFETERLLELLAIGLLGGSVFLIIGLKCSKKTATSSTMVIFFAIGSVYFILAAFAIGRQYLIEWRRFSKHTYAVVSAPNCCSPAILYAADMAKRLSSYLKTVKCTNTFPIDIAMDHFAKQNSYKKYLVEPNLFQHIGMISSIKTKSKHPEQFIYR